MTEDITSLLDKVSSINVEEKIIDAIIENSKYVSAVFDIEDSIEAMQVRILKKKFLAPLREIAKDSGFEKFEIDLNGNVEKEKYSSFYFDENKVNFWLYKEKWNYLAICLSFRKEKNGFSYGFNSKEKLKNNQKIIDEANSILSCKETKSLWKNWAYSNKFFIEVTSEKGIETMKTEFRNVIKELSEIGDRLEAMLLT